MKEALIYTLAVMQLNLGLISFPLHLDSFISPSALAFQKMSTMSSGGFLTQVTSLVTSDSMETKAGILRDSSFSMEVKRLFDYGPQGRWLMMAN